MGIGSTVTGGSASPKPPLGPPKILVYSNGQWDQYTNDPNYQPLIAKQLNAGIMTWSPFFDNKLSWFKNPAYRYQDSYAIYVDATRNSVVINAHPEYILKDANGNKLYIPWGCSNGACPQYAGDVGNPGFVAAMVGAAAQIDIPLGYCSFQDDVNMTLDRVADGNGNKAVPIDPRTGQPMTETAWEDYFGNYMASLRAAMKALSPSYRMIHNIIWWYNAVSSVGIDLEIRSADLLAYERGFGDAGITGGTGFWSLTHLMESMDRVHSLGRNVSLLEYGLDFVLYAMACYFAIREGDDTIGYSDLTPNLWEGGALRIMNIDLGNPLGPRTRQSGLISRYFDKGYVLVVEPGAGPFTINPDQNVFDVYTGLAVTAPVTLQPKSGGIYLYD